MLLERQQIIENELERLRADCASIYYDIIVNGNVKRIVEYRSKIDKLNSLTTDLSMIAYLISNDPSLT